MAGETFICENVLVVAIEQAAAVVGPPLEGSRSALDGGVRVGYGAFADRCLDEWNVIGFEERSDATFALGRFASFADLTHVSDRTLGVGREFDDRWRLACSRNVPLHELAQISMGRANQAQVGYIPNGKVFGVSKLARLIDMYASPSAIDLSPEDSVAALGTLRPTRRSAREIGATRH